ncbi:MAG: 5-bromo-4-chloroindolyl phosphate hydrolysis family protein [Pseudomonadota bacterium]
MAQRFGGKYSPGAGKPANEGSPGPTPPSNRFRGQSASSVDVRSLAMFVFPTPLLFAALGAVGDNAIRMAAFLLAYAVLMFGAFLLREGQKAHAAYDARSIAKAPAFPRKICAAALAGIGVFLSTWMAAPASDGGALAQIASFGGNMVNAVIFGGITVGAHLAAFGVDPMKNKGVEDSNIHQAELDRVTEALEKAESKLKSIEDLAHTLRDREIDAKVGSLNATVRQMIKLVEEDPRDLSRARRYLGVYLKGAEDATRKYATNAERLNDPKLREDYLALLSDLEAGFQRGKESLLADDRADLEVEIEVLRERLEQEGA